RSLARVLDKHGASEALPELLAELGLGEDEWGESTAPGWRLEETHDGEPTGRILGGLGALGAALPGSRLTGNRPEIEVGSVLRVRVAFSERFNRGARGCVTFSAEPGDRLVVTQFQRTGTGLGFGTARRDSDGVELPFRGEHAGHLYDIEG